MERLTYMDGGKWRIRIGDTEYSGKEIDRFASYEDTGLEPETISKIRDIVLDISGDLSRLRDLVQADREGRCIIAPVKPGEIAWGGHARFDPVLGETKNVIYPVILKGWWTGLKDYEYEPREFQFGDLYESYDAAEKALEGEKNG